MKQLANLRRHSKKDAVVFGRSTQNARCKKHPKHLQSPGVCSLCLRKKLAQLTAAASSSRAKPSAVAAADQCSSCSSSSVSSISSYYSSASASSRASPMRPYRFAMERIKGSSTSIFLFNGRHVLTKSKTVGAVEQGVEKRKKLGFWFNLLRPKSKRSMENQSSQPWMHSRTLTIRDTLQQPVDV